MASTLSPILASDTITMSLVYKRSFDDIARLTGYHLLGVCAGGILSTATARVYGKRHLLLLGLFDICVCCLWAARASTYKSMVWARVFQGLGVAPFEALGSPIVGDLFFVHVRIPLHILNLSCLC
jgi:MFS family permease